MTFSVWELKAVLSARLAGATSANFSNFFWSSGWTAKYLKKGHIKIHSLRISDLLDEEGVADNLLVGLHIGVPVLLDGSGDWVRDNHDDDST